MAEDLGKKPDLQPPIGWDAEIHGEIAGESKFSCQWITEGLQVTQIGQRPEDLLQAHKQGPDEQPC